MSVNLWEIELGLLSIFKLRVLPELLEVCSHYLLNAGY